MCVLSEVDVAIITLCVCVCVCVILFSVIIICNCIYFYISLLRIVPLLGRGGWVGAVCTFWYECLSFGSFSLRELTCMHCVYLAL